MSKSKIKRYRLPIFLTVIIWFFNAILPALASDDPFTTLIPANSMGLQIAILFWSYVVGAIIGVLLGFVLTPLFLIVHKKIIGRKMIYGIQERPEPEKFKGIFKAFFPSLMALNFALLYVFNPMVEDFLKITAPGFAKVLVSLFMILMVTFGLAVSLFSPAWFLLDAGIVYSNREKVKNSTNPIETRGVGGWYMGLLKGYAGISVIIAFYSFVYDVLDQITPDQFHFSQPLLLLLLPLLFCLWSMPAVLLFELTREKRRKFVWKWAKKLEITKDLNLEITQK
jgi:MFS family permease